MTHETSGSAPQPLFLQYNAYPVRRSLKKDRAATQTASHHPVRGGMNETNKGIDPVRVAMFKLERLQLRNLTPFAARFPMSGKNWLRFGPAIGKLATFAFLKAQRVHPCR